MVTQLDKKFLAFIYPEDPSPVHKIAALDNVPSQFNPAHSFTSYFSEIHVNIILASTSRYSK
jgi:hypothetical protein